MTTVHKLSHNNRTAQCTVIMFPGSDADRTLLGRVQERQRFVGCGRGVPVPEVSERAVPSAEPR